MLAWAPLLPRVVPLASKKTMTVSPSAQTSLMVDSQAPAYTGVERAATSRRKASLLG